MDQLRRRPREPEDGSDVIGLAVGRGRNPRAARRPLRTRVARGSRSPLPRDRARGARRRHRRCRVVGAGRDHRAVRSGRLLVRDNRIGVGAPPSRNPRRDRRRATRRDSHRLPIAARRRRPPRCRTRPRVRSAHPLRFGIGSGVIAEATGRDRDCRRARPYPRHEELDRNNLERRDVIAEQHPYSS